jgi:hypothetical protein
MKLSVIETKTKLSVIETKTKIYITDQKLDKNSYERKYTSTDLLDYVINGQKPNPSFHHDWVIIDKIPKKIEKLVHQNNINKRYELKDHSLESDKIPLLVPYEKIPDDFENISSLYEFKSDEQPDVLKEIEFEIVETIKFNDIKEFHGFSYPIKVEQSFKTVDSEITEKDVKHQLLDKIMFPNLMLPSCNCKLTSKQSYNIVREYVKNNIDPKYAEITSDYDFCFTVKKRIKLTETQEYTVDVNFGHNLFSKRKRRPKYKKQYRDYRSVEVFEMTYSPKCYNNYTPIDGFEGKDQDDLVENINSYLKELIEVINEPIVDCPHCKGAGVEEIKVAKT